MLVLRQRPEEEVDRQALAARKARFQQLQRAVQKRHVAARRNDVSAVGLHHHAVLHLENLHARVTPDQVGEEALVVRSQMLHQHKGHVRIGVDWHAGEERLKRRQPPGGRPDAHDRKPSGGRGVQISARRRHRSQVGRLRHCDTLGLARRWRGFTGGFGLGGFHSDRPSRSASVQTVAEITFQLRA